MAILEGIRRRTGLLLVFVAGALVLFLIQDFAQDLIGFTKADGVNYKGQIGTVRVKSEEFERKVDLKVAIQKQIHAQRQQEMPTYLINSIEQQVWNEYLHDFAFSPIYNDAGIVVTTTGTKGKKSEKLDLLTGITVSESVKQSFAGPNEEFKQETVINYLQSVDAIEDANQKRFQEIQLEQTLNDWAIERLQQKYESLFSSTNYVTTVEAKRKYDDDNSTASFDVIYIPFYSLPDSVISFTDTDLKNHLEKNRNLFTFKDGRVIEYVVFDVLPSGEDTLTTFKDASTTANNFRTTKNDTSFYKFNSDRPTTPSAYTFSQLPKILQEDSSYLKPGFVKGPILEASAYNIYKILGTQEDEIAQTAHILIPFKGDEDSLTTRTKALEVLAKARSGQDFGALAAQYSEDGGSKENKGEYPEQSKSTSQWVKPFHDAVFNATRTGVQPQLVETTYGYHIMKILKTSTPSDKLVVVKLTKNITPSKRTRDLVNREVNIFRKGLNDGAELAQKAKDDENIYTIESPLLNRSSKSIGSVYNADRVVTWAFNPETNIGDVSEAISIPSNNKYVIATLKRISDKNKPQVDDARAAIERSLYNEMKGKLLKEKLNETEGDLHERFNNLNEENGEGYAKYKVIKDHKYSSNGVPEIAVEPMIVGVAFAQDPEEWSKTHIGNEGVFIVRTNDKKEAQEIADYTAQKNSLEKQNINYRLAISNAITNEVGVKDNDK